MASPFNRPNQGAFRGQPPPNFKANPTRAKTQKWVDAKGASYDGDEWGEVDEYDEYGADQYRSEPVPQVPQQQQKATGLRHAGQSAGGPLNGGRNFTDPRGAPTQGIQRQQSFDVGDERRTFSAGMPRPPPTQGQLPEIPQGAPLHVETSVPISRVDTSSSVYPSAGGLASSSGSTPYSANPEHRRDFSPTAMPPPLNPQSGPGSPQTMVDTSSPVIGRPPRKSSLSQPNSPFVNESQAPVDEQTPRARAPSNPTKPLPFIRPADIYKRMEEERARERSTSSAGSNRPSMDSLQPGDDAHRSPSKRSSSESLPNVQEERAGTPASQRKPTLAPVAEGQAAASRKSYLEDRPAFAPQISSSGLPQSDTSSSFSDEFSQFTSPQRSQQAPQSQADLQHQPSVGFRSVVEQAFDRPDDSKSIPPTPMSTQSSLRSPNPSDISRSNTDSTSGISPIMSRVPSVGAAVPARNNNQQYNSFDLNATPTIAEEPAGSSRPTSMQGPPATAVQRKPSPSHSREPSAESTIIPGYRRQETPPSRGSPARTPALETGRRTPEPQAAHLTATPPVDDSSYREADLLDAVRAGREEDVARAAAVGSTASPALMQSHDTASSELQGASRPESPANSRSQSPFKGRVQQLAGKFDDIAEANSRRNSSHSIASRQSWEVDSRKSWAEGQEQLQIEHRPPLQTEASFRPHLPGQWESYTTNRPSAEPVVAPYTTNAAPSIHQTQSRGEAFAAERAADADLTPTTAREQLQSDEVHNDSPSIIQNPLAALTAAGAAIGESLKTSVGLGNDEAPKEAEGDKFDEVEESRTDPDRLSTGNILTRPGALRIQSAVSDVSTVPPTPPPKDVDPISSTVGGSDITEDDDLKPPVPLKSRDTTPVPETVASSSNLSPDLSRPMMLSQLSSDSAFDDDENDRLRKDIVRTLSPQKDHADKLPVPSDIPGNRESNVLPSEYGEYWEGATPDGTRYSRMPGETHVGPQGVEMSRPEHITEEASPIPTDTPKRPGFLDNRFSWEKTQDSGDFSGLTGLGVASGTDGAAAPALPTHPEQHRAIDGSDAPEVVEPPREPVSEPSLTVDDLPRHSSDRSLSPPPTGLHIVNVRGAEEAVDMPPRLKTPEPRSEPRLSYESAASATAVNSQRSSGLKEQEPEPVDERDFATGAQPVPEPAPTSSLVPAAEVSSLTSLSASKPRIPPFRELAAIPNPQDRIRAYESTRETFATTDTGLQGWLAQTLAAHPEHSHLLRGGPQLFPINTRAPTTSGGPAHRASPSMSKFTNILSPSSPQQGQNLDSPRPLPQSASPGGAGPSAGGSIGAQKGKELLQNAGALGGKVGQGAKGLFAKGRSKFRAASGSDKVPTPPMRTNTTPSISKSNTPSPAPSQTLSRASTQPIEQPTPTSRRSSPFRRFSSRPSSMAVSEADTIPEVPNEPLPPISRHSTPDNRSTASGMSMSKRRMSPFRRRSRPSSAVTTDSMAAVPEIPKEPIPLHQRSATVGGVLMNGKSKGDEDRGKLKGLRRLSAFRRSSRPSSVAVHDNSASDRSFPGGFPKDLTYTGDRRASYAFGSTIPLPPPTAMDQRRASVAVATARASLPPAPDIWGGPEKMPEANDDRPPSKLGILPTPTQDTFGFPPSEPSSPEADEDNTPRATQFDPNQTALEDHLGQFVPSPIEFNDDGDDNDFSTSQPPQRRVTAKSFASEDETRHSRLIESIVRHASPGIRDIESRRQSVAGVSGGATPSVEKADPVVGDVPLLPARAFEPPPAPVPGNDTPALPAKTFEPPAASISATPVAAKAATREKPTVIIPKTMSVKAQGKRPARDEIMPSPEPPLPPKGAGIIPTSPVDYEKEKGQMGTIDRNVSKASIAPEPVSALEPSPEPNEEKSGPQSTLVSREISASSSRPALGGEKVSEPDTPVSREVSSVTKSSRSDVSPISDEGREAPSVFTTPQQVTYGERKHDWLDDSDEDDMKTPMERPQPQIPTSPYVAYGQMDKEIMIDLPTEGSTTEDEWEKVSRDETSRAEGTETREGWHTPDEGVDHDDEEAEINEAGTASSGHVRQISDIAKLNRESLRLKAEAAAARASVQPEPLPNQVTLVDHIAAQAQQLSSPSTPRQSHRTSHEPDVNSVRQAAAGAEEEDLPPPVPPKSPGPAVPARQSPFTERASPVIPQQASPANKHLQRPSFGSERPLSFQMLPRPGSGSVPQDQITIVNPQDMSQRQHSPLASPSRVRPPIPQPKDYSQTADTSQSQKSPDGDSPRSAGLRRTSGPIQPPQPSDHVRQKSIDKLSQPLQPVADDAQGNRRSTQPVHSASNNPQNNPMVSRTVDPRMYQGQPFEPQAIDRRRNTGTEVQVPGVGPPLPQVREPRGLPMGFLRGTSSQPSPDPVRQQQSAGMNPLAVVPPNQRMPTYQSTGSGTESPEERKAKKPGFFGGLRPPSTGAHTPLSQESTKAHPSVSPTRIHYLSDIERQRELAAASGKLTKTDKRVERAQSSSELTGGKKKRFSSLTGLFGRSGTTGHAPPSRERGSVKKLQKINEQKTPSPAQGQGAAPPPMPQQYPPPQQQQQPQDFRPQSNQSSVHTWNGTRAGQPPSAYGEQIGQQAQEDFKIPPGGFYAPENADFVPSGQGSRGYTAISQQASGSYSYGQGQPTLPNVQEDRATTYINGAQHSPPPHRWKRPSDSPAVIGAAANPNVGRHMSTGSHGLSIDTSPPPVRHASAPGQSQGIGYLRPQHAPRMPSIGEDGRHQERPYAISLPQGPPDPQSDAHRRNSIQYAMEMRQQISQQQLQFQQQQMQPGYQYQQQPQQYYSPSQSETTYAQSNVQAPYDMPTYPAHTGHHPQGRYSEIRTSQGQAPVLTLDPAAIARIKLEAQENRRQREIEAQRLHAQQRLEAEQQRLNSAPDDENSLYAPPTRPQTAWSPQEASSPPLPTQYYPPPGQQPTIMQPNPQSPQQVYDPQAYEQRTYQQYAGREAVMPQSTEPQHYPLPTSPTDTVASPINPMASQMSPPPLPQFEQQQPAYQRPSGLPQSPGEKAGGFSAHRNYPSAASINVPPPPYRRDRTSVDDRMAVPSETLMRTESHMRTERRTEELRHQIEARRQGQRQIQERPAQQRRRQDEDEPVVMHAASYPGMEWEPRWED